MAIKHFVQIEITEKKVTTAYRFYGRGEWKKRDNRSWRPINAIYIPAEVLSVAAAQCSTAPPPILTEMDIARLCGGSR